MFSSPICYLLEIVVFNIVYFTLLFTGQVALTFRTPPVSPPRASHLSTGMRRVCSLEFRPQLMNSPESGLADPLLSCKQSLASESSLLPQSTIYSWSCGHFSKPLLTARDDSEELLDRREQRERLSVDHIKNWEHTCRSFYPSSFLVLYPLFW